MSQLDVVRVKRRTHLVSGYIVLPIYIL